MYHTRCYSVLDFLYVLTVIVLMFKRSTGTLYNVLIMGIPADVLLFFGMAILYSAVIILGGINLIVKCVLNAFLID